MALRTNQLEITTGNFAVAVAYLFTLVFSVSWLAARSLKPGRWMDAFASGVSVLLLNVFTHVGQTIALRRYTPGVFTAVLVALPYSLYALRRLRAEQLLDKQRVRQCLLAGAFVGVPLAVSAHVVAGRLTHFVRLVKQ